MNPMIQMTHSVANIKCYIDIFSFSYSVKRSSWFLSLMYITLTVGKTMITLFLGEKTKFTLPNTLLPVAFCNLFCVLTNFAIMHTFFL